tara:strand:+ start:24989 stop:25615 length:627 start_codon:yes stop_codon:yes gene_type:complete
MGFDIYGLNPKINKFPSAILSKFSDDNGFTKWSEMDDEDKKVYYAEEDKHQIANPGQYFRANVWFWRPVWNFVCASCDDFLSDKDIRAGDTNSGDIICKTKANKIASRLNKLNKQGLIQEWEDKMMIPITKAELYNKTIDIEIELFQTKMKKKYKDDLIHPRSYNDEDNKLWTDICNKKDTIPYYPPSATLIVDFAKFCKESGGFEIC